MASLRRNPTGRHTRNAGAFTLVELLAVLAIMALLITLLFPVVKRTMKSAGGAKCVSNLRQIGIANLEFAKDHNGEIAAGGYWANYWYQYEIRPYLGGTSEADNFLEVLVCPNDETHGWGNPAAPYEVLRRSYGVNGFVRQGSGGKRLVAIPSPSKIVYAGDTGKSPIVSSWIGGSALWLDSMPASRHGGKINYVFLDGHVAGFDIATLYPGGSNHAIFTGE